MGIRSAFGIDADFSGVADEPLHISELEQKTSVEVNEEGTEAAAATTTGMAHVLARSSPPPQFRMIVDHPFFVVIREDLTGAILFMGAIGDPR